MRCREARWLAQTCTHDQWGFGFYSLHPQRQRNMAVFTRLSHLRIMASSTRCQRGQKYLLNRWHFRKLIPIVPLHPPTNLKHARSSARGRGRANENLAVVISKHFQGSQCWSDRLVEVWGIWAWGRQRACGLPGSLLFHLPLFPWAQTSCRQSFPPPVSSHLSQGLHPPGRNEQFALIHE